MQSTRKRHTNDIQHDTQNDAQNDAQHVVSDFGPLLLIFRTPHLPSHVLLLNFVGHHFRAHSSFFRTPHFLIRQSFASALGRVSRFGHHMFRRRSGESLLFLSISIDSSQGPGGFLSTFELPTTISNCDQLFRIAHFFFRDV